MTRGANLPIPGDSTSGANLRHCSTDRRLPQRPPRPQVKANRLGWERRPQEQALLPWVGTRER
eukprot:13293854-Alexandrium_andersonii.AAC.1